MIQLCAYTTVAGIVAFVLFEVFLRVLSRIGLRTPIDELGNYIETVMRAGADGARLLLRVPRRRRIEFLKVAPRGGHTRFLLVMSSRHCSPEEFAKARYVLGEAGIPFGVFKTGGQSAEERLVVECGRNLGLATNAARAVLFGSFGVGPSTPLRVGHIGGIAWREGAVIGWEYPESPENVGIIDYRGTDKR